MHLLLDLVLHNLPANGLGSIPASLRDRAAALYRSYATDRTTFARSALKVAQVLLYRSQHHIPLRHVLLSASCTPPHLRVPVTARTPPWRKES